MEITGIISALVIGLIIGALGRLIVPGKQHLPIWLTLLLGIVAAFVGGFLASLISSAWWWVVIVQVLVAAAIVYVVDGVYSKKGKTP
ncbi:GlsB/YeaQ/YmgE family stress response membrane protein [Nocardiopsis sp. CNT312]|uniref:GlsB/YeaQ/YmgE family stress response membrane protein n=1 Tax=Nocardiopsis sp. CNT312 TaxID=1137268 RepID=UPI000491DAFA|nr:GlsB/YeaQ/YmgE family stress response membrane protein [Nocardiopsis sp. CNT312]